MRAHSEESSFVVVAGRPSAFKPPWTSLSTLLVDQQTENDTAAAVATTIIRRLQRQEMGEDCQSFSFAADLILWCESLVLEWSESPSIVSLVIGIRHVLRFMGAPDDFGPSPLDTCRSIIAIVLTLIFYFVLFGNRHQRRRRRLAQELQVAQAELAWLQEKLRFREEVEDGGKKKKEIRIFMDGAFDLMHYGHMNAFRLGQSLGTHLVVGVNSDESITKCKGAPLMNDDERMTMVESCKFVDEVVRDCPYIMNKDYLEYVIEKYKIDYVIHGDDPCIVDGKDVYEEAKKSGKFRSIPRTEGVSTTDIVGRMLLLTKAHHTQEGESVLGSQSRFLTTSRMLQLFSKNVKAPEKSMRVIYIDGTWDLFHPGHVKILKAAKERGDFLIVGIHGDAIVNKRRGMNLPLMNLNERVLSVLGCRYVDDVLIDAPYVITSTMIRALNISEVVHGTNTDDLEDDNYSNNGHDQRYQHAKSANIFSIIQSPSDFKLASIIHRIRRNQEVFQAKFNRKMEAETQFYEQKYDENAATGTHTCS